MSRPNVKLRWKRLHPQAELPRFATAGAAAFDLKASFDGDVIVMRMGEVVAIPTGLAVEVPMGYELQVRARSGLAIKHGFTLVNGVGTIDSDYRGEIKVIATLLSKEPLTVKSGERIAQALVAELVPTTHVEVKDLSSSERGVGGFGSTGV